MEIDIPKPDEICMSAKQIERLRRFIFCDDLDFYEEYVINLTDEQQEKFFEENPGFMSEFHMNRDKIYLLKDEMFRKIMKL